MLVAEKQYLGKLVATAQISTTPPVSFSIKRRFTFKCFFCGVYKRNLFIGWKLLQKLHNPIIDFYVLLSALYEYINCY